MWEPIVFIGFVVVIMALLYIVSLFDCPSVDQKALRLYHLSKLNIAINDIVSHIDYDTWLMRVVELTRDGFVVCSWQNGNGEFVSHPFSSFEVKAPPKIEGPLF